MLGCGLDTRYQRISPLCKKAKFYYVDLEEVIEVRRYFLPPGSNEHLIPCSMFDLAWWAGITTQERNSDYLIIVEGVLVYFSAEENKKFINLVSSVASGAELVFDIVCNDLIDNYRQKEKDTLLKFGLDDISQLESWEERLKISKIIDLKDCAGYKAMLALIKQHNLENMKYSTKLVVTKIN